MSRLYIKILKQNKWMLLKLFFLYFGCEREVLQYQNMLRGYSYICMYVCIFLMWFIGHAPLLSAVLHAVLISYYIDLHSWFVHVVQCSLIFKAVNHFVVWHNSLLRCQSLNSFWYLCRTDFLLHRFYTHGLYMLFMFVDI